MVENRYKQNVVVCFHCGGRGSVFQWRDDDVYKQLEAKEICCPRCDGWGLLHKNVTVSVEYRPYKRKNFPQMEKIEQ